MFYRNLAAIIRNIPSREQVVVLGDFNARVGVDHDSWPSCLGQFGRSGQNDWKQTTTTEKWEALRDTMRRTALATFGKRFPKIAWLVRSAIAFTKQLSRHNKESHNIARGRMHYRWRNIISDSRNEICISLYKCKEICFVISFICFENRNIDFFLADSVLFQYRSIADNVLGGFIEGYCFHNYFFYNIYKLECTWHNSPMVSSGEITAPFTHVFQMQIP